MAALSVQYSKAGIKTFQLYCFPIVAKPLRNPLLAETPPARHISVIPVCKEAFFSLFKRSEQWFFVLKRKRLQDYFV